MSKSYEELLKDPRWQKTRLEVLQRANWQCEYCGDEKTELHVHHTFYDGRNPWTYPNDSLKCLCKNCHNSEHSKKDENETIEKEELKALCCGAGMYDWHDFGDYGARQDFYRDEFLFECKRCGNKFWLKEGEAADQIWVEEKIEEEYRAAIEEYGSETEREAEEEERYEQAEWEQHQRDLEQDQAEQYPPF